MNRSVPRGVIRDAAAAAGMGGAPVNVASALGPMRGLRNGTVPPTVTAAPAPYKP